MSTVRKQLLTAQEYLARERAADFKSEFYRGETFAMAGASKEHTTAKDNFARIAGNQLEDGPCQVWTSDMRVKIDATGLYTYPDIVIACDNQVFEDAEVDTLLTPLFIVEVLSDSTEKYDRGDKFGHYRTIKSLQEYVLVAQDRPLIERHVRQGDSWLMTEFKGMDQSFESVALPLSIPFEKIYRNVEFPEPPLGLARPGK